MHNQHDDASAQHGLATAVIISWLAVQQPSKDRLRNCRCLAAVTIMLPVPAALFFLVQGGGMYIAKLLDNMTHAAHVTVRNKAV